MIYNPKCPYTYGGSAHFNGGDAHMQKGGAPHSVRGAPPAGLRRGQNWTQEEPMCALIVCRFVAVVSTETFTGITQIWERRTAQLKHVTQMSHGDSGGNSNRVWWKTWWVTMQQGGKNLLLVASANELQLKSRVDGYPKDVRLAQGLR